MGRISLIVSGVGTDIIWQVVSLGSGALLNSSFYEIATRLKSFVSLPCDRATKCVLILGKFSIRDKFNYKVPPFLLGLLL